MLYKIPVNGLSLHNPPNVGDMLRFIYYLTIKGEHLKK